MVLSIPFFFIAIGLTLSEAADQTIKLGLINGGSTFFGPVETGFLKRCEDLKITCHVLTSGDGPCEEDRFNKTRDLLDLGVNGIAMKPCSPEFARPLFQELTEQGVAVLSFDSDVPNSTQVAHVGTDNVFMGRTMARLLRQLRPEGGTYAIISPKTGRLEGFEQEIQRYNDREDRSHWHHVQPVVPPYTFGGDTMKVMETYAPLNPTAIVTMKQSPMRHPNWTQFVDQNRHRGIIYIGADGSDFQLEYLDQRYVDGLVGQLPYEIGTTSVDALYRSITGTLQQELFRTNVVAYNLIPLALPPVDYNENLLGNLEVLGFSLFCITTITCFCCAGWTLYYRTAIVVRAAQPFFLFMIAGGVLIIASALIPLSFDDGGEPDSLSQSKSAAICMSVPWLAFLGFTVVFSALFSKTWRVNRLFRAAVGLSRIKVTEKDVLAPFVFLMLGNILVLVCWTVFDPLTYSRVERDGTDYWNRVLESYGSCTSDHAARFLVPLGLLNFGVVATACWQALQARDLKSEFSEAKFIGLTVGSVFQAFLTGIPVVVVVRDIPQAYYSVLSLMIFLLCMAVLSLIFFPKMVMQRNYSTLSEAEQKKRLSSRSMTFNRNQSPSGISIPDASALSYGIGDTSDGGFKAKSNASTTPNASWMQQPSNEISQEEKVPQYEDARESEHDPRTPQEKTIPTEQALES